MNIAIFGNTSQVEKSRHLQEVVAALTERKIDICIENGFADFLQEQRIPLPNPIRRFREEDVEADFALSVGGDGTFLNTAAHIRDKGIPILGINTGRLGFLADVPPHLVGPAIDDIYNKEYVVEQRSLIRVEKDGKPLSTYPYALNEVALLKYDNSSLIEIRTRIDGEFLTGYIADGLIVATPTGSTGYALSSGGPILAPDSPTFCIAAVAPHSLSVRPVVVRDDVTIELEVRSRSHQFLISVDGRSESFPDASTLTLRRAPYTIGVMKTRHKSFYQTLRDKMSWGADQRFN
ncbi:MAG: NAD kinase [Alloprevotella sp.]